MNNKPSASAEALAGFIMILTFFAAIALGGFTANELGFPTWTGWSVGLLGWWVLLKIN